MRRLEVRLQPRSSWTSRDEVLCGLPLSFFETGGPVLGLPMPRGISPVALVEVAQNSLVCHIVGLELRNELRESLKQVHVFIWTCIHCCKLSFPNRRRALEIFSVSKSSNRPPLCLGNHSHSRHNYLGRLTGVLAHCTAK